MLKFDKDTHKVENIGILEKEEAEAYIQFLYDEKFRHEDDIGWSQDIIDNIEFHGIFGVQEKALMELWKSAIRRHEEDIKAIDVLVKTLKGFYNL